jgi:hypothetical protein
MHFHDSFEAALELVIVAVEFCTEAGVIGFDEMDEKEGHGI